MTRALSWHLKLAKRRNMVSKEDLENLIYTLSSCRMDNSNTLVFGFPSRKSGHLIKHAASALQLTVIVAAGSYCEKHTKHKHDLPFLCETNATKRHFSEVTRVASFTKGDKTNICFTCVYS